MKRARTAARGWILAIGSHVASAPAMALVIASAPDRSGQIALVYPPSGSPAESFAQAAATDARIVRLGGAPWIVVASEVRGLAQRSAAAAKEIKSPISASSNPVDKGVALVQRTGDALRRIVGEIAGISDVVIEIAGSTESQSSELGHINGSVSEIDRGVRHNAERFKTSYGETRSVAGQAAELERLSGFFQLPQAPGAMRAAPTRTAARIRSPATKLDLTARARPCAGGRPAAFSALSRQLRSRKPPAHCRILL